MRLRHIALSLCIVFCSVPAWADPLVISGGEWPPYLSENFKYGGIVSRICSESFALAKIDVEIEYVPWKRALEGARQGDFSGSLGWRKTPEREKDFHFTDPIIMANTVFFHRLGSDFDWKTLDDIGGYTVGATLGYAYVEALQTSCMNHGGRLEIAPSDELNLNKLLAGRIDLFPCAEEVGYYLLRTKFLAGAADLVKTHPRPLYQGGLHLLISKKTPNGETIVKKFNEGLKKLKESGRYDQFLDESLHGDYLPEKR